MKVFILSSCFLVVLCQCAKPRYTLPYTATGKESQGGKTSYLLPEVVSDPPSMTGAESVFTVVRSAEGIRTLASLLPASAVPLRQNSPVTLMGAAPSSWKRVAGTGLELMVDIESVRRLGQDAGVTTVLIPVVHVRGRSGSYFQGMKYCPMQQWQEAQLRFVIFSGGSEARLDEPVSPKKEGGFLSRLFLPGTSSYVPPPRFYELHTLEVIGLRCRMVPRQVIPIEAIFGTAPREFLRSIK